MTCPDLIKIAAIKGILESIEEGDPKDAAEAIRLIRAILENGKQP